jgi:hypothetical protein
VKTLASVLGRKRRKLQPPFTGLVGELVLPHYTRVLSWHFIGLHTGKPCGSAAIIRPYGYDCNDLAARMSCVTGDDDRALLAATAWQNLAWLQDVACGVHVLLDQEGRLRADYRSATPEAIRESEAAWCAEQRAHGWIPLVARTRAGWKLVAVPSATQLVDVNELLGRVQAMEGYKSTSTVVPL